MNKESNAVFSGKRVVLGCILYLFCAFGFVNITGIAMGLMPDYYGVSVESIVSSTSITTGVGIAAYFFNGPLYQKFSPRIMMIVGAVLIGVCTVAMAIPSFTGLIIYRIVAGFIGSSCIHTLTTAILVRWYSKELSSKIGLVVLFGVLGVSCFQFISGMELPKFGIGHWYLIAGAVATLVTLLSALFLVRNKPEDIGEKPYGYDPAEYEKQSMQEPKSSMETMKILAKMPIFWLTGLSIFLGAFAEVLFLSYATVYLPTTGLPYTTAATCVSLFVLIGSLVGLISGKIIDKMGLKPFVIMIYLSAAAACAMFALAKITTSPIIIILLVLFSGFAYPVMMINSFCSTPLFGAELSDDANGKLGMFISTGCCLLNLMAAKIIAVSGFQIIYEIFIFFEIAALAVFLVALRLAKKNKQNENNQEVPQ